MNVKTKTPEVCAPTKIGFRYPLMVLRKARGIEDGYVRRQVCVSKKQQVKPKVDSSQSRKGLAMPIQPDDLVDEVMRSHPATIRTFLDFKMGCVGCPIACFHTVDEACAEHRLDRDAVLKALRSAAEQRDGE